MAAVATIAEVQQHVDTDLSDAALQTLIDDADREIVRRFGEHLTASEVHRPAPGRNRLYLLREVSSITSITETELGVTGETDTVLAVSDWEREGKSVLRRVTGGTNSAASWAPLVVVVYVPVSDSARRKRVTIDLVRLAVRYTATSRESVGDVSIDSLEYDKARANLLNQLSSSMFGSMA